MGASRTPKCPLTGRQDIEHGIARSSTAFAANINRPQCVKCHHWRAACPSKLIIDGGAR